ncbi:MAG: hypothetical protein ACHP79_07600 [Terriglobales bacterium]
MPELTERRRNWAPWLGLLLAVAAILSNAGFFLGLPGERAIPWLSLALAIAALVCAVIGVMRAFRQANVYGGKVSSSILGVVSLLICGLAVFTHVHARDLPASAGAPQVGQKAPDFTLADSNGNKVSLGQLLGKADGPAPVAANAVASPRAVLLVFYRGYW